MLSCSDNELKCAKTKVAATNASRLLSACGHTLEAAIQSNEYAATVYQSLIYSIYVKYMFTHKLIMHFTIYGITAHSCPYSVAYVRVCIDRERDQSRFLLYAGYADVFGLRSH